MSLARDWRRVYTQSKSRPTRSIPAQLPLNTPPLPSRPASALASAFLASAPARSPVHQLGHKGLDHAPPVLEAGRPRDGLRLPEQPVPPEETLPVDRPPVVLGGIDRNVSQQSRGEGAANNHGPDSEGEEGGSDRAAAAAAAGSGAAPTCKYCTSATADSGRSKTSCAAVSAAAHRAAGAHP